MGNGVWKVEVPPELFKFDAADWPDALSVFQASTAWRSARDEFELARPGALAAVVA